MRNHAKQHTTAALVAMLAFAIAMPEAHAVRLKDLAEVRGARSNYLVGYGLVVGLAGTGDDVNASFSVQSVVSMLQRLGTHVDPRQLRLRNVAAVMVTATLPPFIAPGQKIDVTVSSIGNAKSLQGGTLLSTPMKGADMKVYAVGQGAISVGGYLVSGRTGSRAQKNHTTVGRVPAGGIVEREVPMDLPDGELRISLRSPDFTTAVRIAGAISQAVSPMFETVAPASEDPTTDEAGEILAQKLEAGEMSWAENAGSVVVKIPESMRSKLPLLISQLEMLNVDPDVPTRVVINERTGTVVLGEGVRLAPVAIAHGGLTLKVQETLLPSQPGPFSEGGETVVVPDSRVTAEQAGGELTALEPGASLGDVVKALNTLGVAPRDLVAILQALKTSGALHAELEIQ